MCRPVSRPLYRLLYRFVPHYRFARAEGGVHLRGEFHPPFVVDVGVPHGGADLRGSEHVHDLAPRRALSGEQRTRAVAQVMEANMPYLRRCEQGAKLPTEVVFINRRADSGYEHQPLFLPPAARPQAFFQLTDAVPSQSVHRDGGLERLRQEQLVSALSAWRWGAVVWDGANAHRGKQLTRVPTKRVALPPYSPELNPAERVFAEIRRRVEAVVYPAIADKQAAVERYLSEVAGTRRGEAPVRLGLADRRARRAPGRVISATFMRSWYYTLSR